MSGARTRRARRLAEIFPLAQELAEHLKEINGVWWARHDSREAWYEAPLPISVNARGDSARAESNFRVAERLIDEASSFGTSYRWDAWPGGQIKTLVIRLDDAGALRMAQGIIYSLSDYPVLDDSDFSELEWEQNHPNEQECYSEYDCCIKCQECDMVIQDGTEPDAIDQCHGYACSLHPENQEDGNV